MKRGFLILFMAFLMITPFIFAENKADYSVENKLNQNEEANVIVFLRHPNIKAEFKNEQDKVLGKINYVYYRDRMQENYDFRLKHKYKTINAFSGHITREGLEKLKLDPDVEKITTTKNYKVSLSESLPLINATSANSLVVNNINMTGSGQSICIIDTGINYSHESFGSCSNASFLNGSCKKILNGTNMYAVNNNILDDHGHGTHVAGIAAANGSIKGVVPDASLIIVKACDSGGNCFEDDIIAGIEWCTLYKEQYNISVISMSIGDGGSYTAASCPVTWSSYINSAYAKNMTIVAASGNEFYANGISHPSCSGNVTSVGASYDYGNSKDNVTSYTNRFNNLDILAPGSVITSTSFDGGSVNKEGTSMATPLVAGAVALLSKYYKEEYGNSINQSAIYNALNSTGKRVLDSSTGFTFSRIDIYSAIISLDRKKPDLWNGLKLPINVNETTNVIFYVNATDTLIDMVLIEINLNGTLNGTAANYSVNKKIGNTYNFTLSSGNFTANQNISWRFYALDKNYNMNSTSMQSFIVNGITPNVVMNYPVNNSYLANGLVDFLFEVNDDGTNLTCSLHIDNAINKTNTTTSINAINNFTVLLAEKIYTSYVNCTDIESNSNKSETTRFTIDLTNPMVYLNYPLNNSIVSTKYFNYTAVDTNMQNCTLYGNWSGWHANKTINAGNNTMQNISADNLIDGNYLWNVNCRDKANRNAFNSTNYSAEIDTTKPAITIDWLHNKTYSYNNSLSLNLSVFELNNLDKKWYNIDNGQNITLNSNATLNVSVDRHVVNAYANDSLNNEAYSSLSFSIDMNYPNVMLISPSNETVKTDSDDITFNYNVSDGAVANCSLIINGAIDQVNAAITAGIEQSFTKTLSNGNYIWNVNCTDYGNLINSSLKYEITINVSSGDDGNNNQGNLGGSSSSSGSGGSSTVDEAEPLNNINEIPEIELPTLPNKEEIKTIGVDENANKNATTENRNMKIPLTGRAISLIKNAAQPKGIIIGILIISIVSYFVIRLRIRRTKNKG